MSTVQNSQASYIHILVGVHLPKVLGVRNENKTRDLQDLTKRSSKIFRNFHFSLINLPSLLFGGYDFQNLQVLSSLQETEKWKGFIIYILVRKRL